jgi:hypothetical protein
LLGQEGFDNKKNPSVFKLDIFDNTDHESRLPTEWVPKTPGKRSAQRPQHMPQHAQRMRHLPPSGVPPTPAKVGKFDAEGNCTWHECLVVDYNMEANTYAVVDPPEHHTNGEAPAAASAPYWVARINLCFVAEDPFVFARRHAEAHAARAKAESLLRCAPQQGGGNNSCSRQGAAGDGSSSSSSRQGTAPGRQRQQQQQAGRSPRQGMAAAAVAAAGRALKLPAGAAASTGPLPQ